VRFYPQRPPFKPPKAGALRASYHDIRVPTLLRDVSQMIIRVAPFLAAVLLCSPAAVLAIPHATTPINAETKDNLIGSGTLIRIRLMQTVTSARNHKGDKFDYEIADNVMAGSRVAIPAGAKGTGKVVSISPAHGGRVDGRLKLEFDPIMLNDGTEVDVGITAASVYADANEKNGMAGDVMQIADMTIPGLFIIDFLRKGSDVTLAAHSPFHIAVRQDAFMTAGTTASPATTTATTTATATTTGPKVSPSAAP
jgi:hypothetical protein